MAGSNPAIRLLQNTARRLSGIEEGVACKGTSLESTTFKVRKKAFLFLRAGEARLKLTESEAEANKLAKSEPARYKVGSHGWVQLKFDVEEPLPRELIERWVKESYSAFASPASSAAKKRRQ
jgi:hypothetical protein